MQQPGELSASGFSVMSGLDVTIADQHNAHMVSQFVLTYSNWEAITVCYSESFESQREGLQNALHRLGGVPRRHRTNRLSAAVNNQCHRRKFTGRYQSLLDHYRVKIEIWYVPKCAENFPHHDDVRKAVTDVFKDLTASASNNPSSVDRNGVSIPRR
ncbi:transposase family protein [Aureliella helgolandensis]|uniref:transposase family protein n=1 Tax=Aureliella helgolandensis TaxID=2527968 RepID=UPI0011A2B382|nr:transposase family protein [Aureliella helgolandensis]